MDLTQNHVIHTESHGEPQIESAQFPPTSRDMCLYFKLKTQNTIHTAAAFGATPSLQEEVKSNRMN